MFNGQRKGRIDSQYARAGCAALLLLCGWNSAPVAHAQGADSAGDLPVRVHGVVLNAVTHSPVGRAFVMTSDQHMALMTDDKGRFEFEVKASIGVVSSTDVARFQGDESNAAYLFVKKPGYRYTGPPYSLPLDDQSALKAEIQLLLMPEATVSGSVTASRSESPLGINVQLLHKQVQDGTAAWQQVQTQEADARGRYRFGGLMPGEYKVVTAEWMDRLGPLGTSTEGPITGYPPQAYPNGTSQLTAGVIHLSGGQDIEADVNARAVPYYPVEIPILSGSPANAVAVTVISKDGPGYSLGFNERTQRVEGALPDGIYHLTVVQNGSPQQDTAQSFFVGNGQLTIAGKQVPGAPITFMRGATIPVSIREEFTRPDPSEQIAASNLTQTVNQGVVPVEQLQPSTNAIPEGKGAPEIAATPPPRAVDVFLSAVDGNGVTGNVNYQQEGAGKEGASLQNVTPGRYKVVAYPRRGYVASLTTNGLNLMRETLVIEPGSTAPAIEIVLRDDVATIAGTLSRASTKETPSARPRSIWAFPLDDDSSARPFSGIEEPGGKFTITSVTPGRYLVLAINGQIANLEYRNKDVMKSYVPNGVIVNVSSGQTVDVALKDAITNLDWATPEED